MVVLQSVLAWLYIFLCLVLIWYGISFLLTLWQWLAAKADANQLSWALFKLAGAAVLTRAVIWIGATLSAGAAW